jgi:2'-5' RNA ligase
MPRLFVAAVLPEPVRDRLLAVRPAALPGLRIVGHDELHLTLHFVGEVGEGKLAAVVRALAAVKAGPFAVEVQGMGRFPEEGEATALWVGVTPSPPLAALHQAIGAALSAAVGYRPEDRPYTPHITLVRVNAPPPAGWVEDYLRQHAALQLTSVPITRFALHSRILLPDSPRYPVEAVFDLSGPGS